MIPVGAEVMREIAPHCSNKEGRRQAAIIAAIGEALRPTLAEYGINTRLRIAHFLGQACHESAGFSTTEEFGRGEQYEGRTDLGNTQPGDGPRYKGRGLLQLTGRTNYHDYGQALHVDLEGNPALAAEPTLSLRIACEYWKRHAINDACDRDDLLQVTRLINGGLNGLQSRRGYTSKAKAALARVEGIQASGQSVESTTHPVLWRGSQGEPVGDLQRLLRSLGFDLAIDGDFGPATELAVMRFQSAHKMEKDGIVGEQTWAALTAAAQKTAAA